MPNYPHPPCDLSRLRSGTHYAGCELGSCCGCTWRVVPVLGDTGEHRFTVFPLAPTHGTRAPACQLLFGLTIAPRFLRRSPGCWLVVVPYAWTLTRYGSFPGVAPRLHSQLANIPRHHYPTIYLPTRLLCYSVFICSPLALGGSPTAVYADVRYTTPSRYTPTPRSTFRFAFTDPALYHLNNVYAWFLPDFVGHLPV